MGMMPIVTPHVLPITLYLIHVALARTVRSLSVLVLELACLCCFSQSYPSLTETPHEALIAKLQKAEATITKRAGADEASKLRDMALKTKEVVSSQKWVEMMEEIPSFLYPGLVSQHTFETSVVPSANLHYNAIAGTAAKEIQLRRKRGDAEVSDLDFTVPQLANCQTDACCSEHPSVEGWNENGPQYFSTWKEVYPCSGETWCD